MVLKSLQTIENPNSHKEEKWLKYLLETTEVNFNVNRLKTISDLNTKCVFNYVKKTLELLSTFNNEDPKVIAYVEETLKWSDVAKCGLKSERKEWAKKGYNLRVHNLGSAEIYRYDTNNYNHIVYLLIKTHGLIGQNIQGEINLSLNSELYNLIEDKLIEKETLRRTLQILNYCILNAVKDNLYELLENDIENRIDLIINDNIPIDNFYNPDYIIERIKILRRNNFTDNYDELKQILENKDIVIVLGNIFKYLELWYFEASLNDFSLEEIIKIFLLINTKVKDVKGYKHLTFENIMKIIYFDYEGRKVINIYKRRIIETYLKNLNYEDLLNRKLEFSKHISATINIYYDTLEFNLEFSLQATKLIEFCEVSYGSDEIYNKAIFLLYDLFGFRRDTYDRFYNEKDYLETMNSSLGHKAKILDYIKGNKILDIGPGGGALMDLILDKKSDVTVYGIDLSQNVIDELTKKKNLENRKWNLVKGDALALEQYFDSNKIDTIIYSSIIHELFSYIETDGKKFNKKTIENAMKSAYNILPIGGRIIIRDGIKSEPETDYRIVEFKNIADLQILDNYCRDFKGREITYTKIEDNKVKMLVNDAMEFLYTYTWGQDSYALEIHEQFGYFTPSEYVKFFEDVFGNKFKLIECKHFLQDGYEENLLNKISIYDEKGNIVKLPDSTCIIVVEKIK